MNQTSSSIRERWQQVIEEQRSSGLSVARFCREQGLAESSLFAWKRRLAREAREAEAEAAPAFVPVTTAAAERGGNGTGGDDGAIELHLGGGRHLLLRPGFDAGTLAAALAVLDGEEGR